MNMTIVYFFYGLAFFAMGFGILLERGRASDEHIRAALRPLAWFGLIHGGHEWLEMFFLLEIFTVPPEMYVLWEALRVALLAISFISLTAFGATLLAPTATHRRLSLLLPLAQLAIWSFGLLIMRGQITIDTRLWDSADVWTRYVLGIPAALFACGGLVIQQREFRQAGMKEFGRDSLWAALAFGWYGLVGQFFARPSPLPPSTIVNETLFLHWFGFPIQLVRMLTAIVAAVFIIRFLRTFEVEQKRKLEELNQLQLREAKYREELRGELFKRVVEAQERERHRIARELHDETGQAITALGMGLRGITKHLGNGTKFRAMEHAATLETLATHTLDELHRIITDLRPSHLDDLGLRAALRWYVGDIQKRSPLRIHIETTGEHVTLENNQKLCLFRIAQEALNNTIKHANATDASVCLTYYPDRVVLQIHDNGQGFETNDVENSKHHPWGLAGMRERASLLGGELHLESSPEDGTLVVVTLPYENLPKGSSL